MLTTAAPTACWYCIVCPTLTAAGERLRLLHDTLAIFTEVVTHPAFAETEIAYVSRTGEAACAGWVVCRGLN